MMQRIFLKLGLLQSIIRQLQTFSEKLIQNLAKKKNPSDYNKQGRSCVSGRSFSLLVIPVKFKQYFKILLLHKKKGITCECLSFQSRMESSASLIRLLSLSLSRGIIFLFGF